MQTSQLLPKAQKKHMNYLIYIGLLILITVTPTTQAQPPNLKQTRSYLIQLFDKYGHRTTLRASPLNPCVIITDSFNKTRTETIIYATEVNFRQIKKFKAHFSYRSLDFEASIGEAFRKSKLVNGREDSSQSTDYISWHMASRIDRSIFIKAESAARRMIELCDETTKFNLDMF
ncbi:MAG: hypothetical protein GQ532_16495 [Methylomarinum sp.]|nr:hypothetical protein [Methylomarinum sp.]